MKPDLDHKMFHYTSKYIPVLINWWESFLLCVWSNTLLLKPSHFKPDLPLKVKYKSVWHIPIGQHSFIPCKSSIFIQREVWNKISCDLFVSSTRFLSQVGKVCHTNLQSIGIHPKYCIIWHFQCFDSCLKSKSCVWVSLSPKKPDDFSSYDVIWADSGGFQFWALSHSYVPPENSK